MLPSVKAGLLLAAGLSGTAFLCPLCGGGIQTAGAQNAPVTAQAPDTATVRLHISRMTCGSCPTTARLALKKLPGVYGATVTLDDSLGVVRYDRSEEHTSELQSRLHLVCRLLLEKKKKNRPANLRYQHEQAGSVASSSARDCSFLCFDVRCSCSFLSHFSFFLPFLFFFF